MHGRDEIDSDKMRQCLRESFHGSFDYLQTFLSCKLCKKLYADDVVHALGWGIWKMHASKPDSMMYHDSLVFLAIALDKSNRHDEGFKVLQAAAECQGLDHSRMMELSTTLASEVSAAAGAKSAPPRPT